MYIIIPAFEPDNKMLKLITEIQQQSQYAVLIVNDGSSERCHSVFKQATEKGCIVLTHETNLGKGASLKTAFFYLLINHPEEDVICADCDGQHRWKDIKHIADTLPNHRHQIILGTREFVGNVPIRSLIGNKLTKSVFSLVSGYKVKDTQTGLRGFSSDMLPWLIQIKGNRYEYEMQQLLDAQSSGFSIFNVPVKTIYENNNKGSHFRPIVDSIRIYLPILKFILTSISCGFLDFIFLFLLNWLTNNLLLSVIGARIISSFCNYMLNKNIVFQTKRTNNKNSAIKYYGLVIYILACNYLMLEFFTHIVLIPLIASKIMTEIILFVNSYYAQKRFIF
ncbi:bifunctional glycosyltransferase family 2/GtrA family protein [Viridibacillus arvi]|uniref:bifunctional glycosyltransferase family 2/GtrA family protein n=1 Tax=Viridibacillus arvi TaxID=263475 RepID=UPI0036C6BD24